MARIAMPDVGNVVARPGPVVQSNPDAFGAAGARALQQAGNMGMQIADRALQQQELERKQAEREAAAEAKAAAREADRVKAVTATARVQNGLADLTANIDERIRTGDLPREKAAETFQTESEKLLQTGLADVPLAHKELVNASLLDNVGNARRGVLKVVTQRERDDIKAGGLAYIEEMQRYGARGPKEADEAIANVRNFWTATAAQAGEDSATAQARIQRFSENIRMRQATDLVNADPRVAMKALKDKNYLPELDPDRRSALIQNADATILRQQQRAEIQAQAYQRKMDQEWKAASTVLEAGKSLDPEYAATLEKKFKGTSYEGALKSLMADGPAQAAFAAQPVAQQEATLLQMQSEMNTRGATPEKIKAYQRAEAAFKASQTDIKEDPYRAATERGVVATVEPLSIDLATLPQQLAKRAEQAGVVSQWAGKEVSLFRPDEARKVTEVLAAMPPKDRAGALSGLAKAMTPGQMRAYAAQAGAKDDTLASAVMYAARGATTPSGRNVSELVMIGTDAMKEQRLKWPTGMGQEVVRQEIDKLTRGAFLSENANRAAGDAALAIVASQLAEGKNPNVKAAVQEATGGIMDMNGQKIVKPYGWTDGQVLKSLRDFDAPRVESLAGGKPLLLGGKPVSAGDLAQNLRGAQLGPAPRAGAYTVSIGGRLVTDENGRPFMLPLEAR